MARLAMSKHSLRVLSFRDSTIFPRAASAMASSRTINLDETMRLDYYRPPISVAAMATASELLQKNHDCHHIFFNSAGFHNHIVHHLLTLLALAASQDDLERAFRTNKIYQLSMRDPDKAVIKALQDPRMFLYYCNTDRYEDFLDYFKQEIERKTWQRVINEYIFTGGQLADSMRVRLFDGILHPWIHLGFGVESKQPSIIAEALAQTACHSAGLGPRLFAAEEAAKEKGGNKSILELLEEARLSGRDTLSQVAVAPDQLERRTAEMINAVAHSVGTYALESGSLFKFDFCLVHHVNASIFSSTFLRQAWIAPNDKARLLEWKIRLDMDAISRKTSPLTGHVREYRPLRPSGWNEVERRVCALDEDGHASKCIRALAHGHQVCRSFGDDKMFALKEREWLQLAHMVIDSAEAFGDSWAR